MAGIYEHKPGLLSKFPTSSVKLSLKIDNISVCLYMPIFSPSHGCTDEKFDSIFSLLILVSCLQS